MNAATPRLSPLLCLLLLGGCSSLFESDPPPECTAEDADMDGFLSVACGGRDCDDEDPNVNPDQAEVCDVDGVDEDCNPMTLGPDEDGDGKVDLDCCNVSADGLNIRCGTDCDDTNAAVAPGMTEMCNGQDDDCDFEADEGLEDLTFYPDCDMDGEGDDSALVIFDCDTPLEAPICGETGFDGAWSSVQGDCDDLDPSRQDACGACAAVDLLVVMDTSNSMETEQQTLAAQLPRFVRALATGDIDGDGTPEREPIEDLNVGIITPDLGTGGFTVPTCAFPEFGEDARLRTFSGADRDPACSDRSFPPFLSFVPSVDLPMIDAFVEDTSCLVRAGTGGCSFEQQLEASLKAVTPAGSHLRFFRETLGHGDGFNRGLLRDDSLLVILHVTDEDDCSAADPELYNPSSSIYPGDINTRCVEHPEALHSINRYVSGLLSLRGADDLIYALVSGVPEDLLPAPPAPGMRPERPDYDAILSDPRMTPRTTGGPSPSVVAACTTDGGREIPPARRLMEVARGLDERGVRTMPSSMCASNAYDAVIEGVLSTAAIRGAERCARIE